jgi:hypothetical protein
VRRVAAWPRAFWDFWWDFLVGDTPELFVAALVILAVALILRPHSSTAVIVLPLLAVCALVASTYRGARTSPRSRAAAPPEAERPEASAPPSPT